MFEHQFVISSGSFFNTLYQENYQEWENLASTVNADGLEILVWPNENAVEKLISIDNCLSHLIHTSEKC